MTYEQVGAALIAAAVVAWPKVVAGYNFVVEKLKVVPLPLPAPVSPQDGSVGYEQAIHNLALVRSRLNATGLLGDEKSPQRAAIDTLTLALVAGSDK
jgi:hypothetical protein